MKRIYLAALSILLFISFNNSFAQPLDKLKEFEISRNEINRNGMIVLGSWAIANLIVGTAGNFISKNESKFFHQFNAMWNTVNLGLAIGGYIQSQNMLMDSISASSIISGYQNLQNILLLNAGLDIAYIVTGFYLKERSKNSSDNFERLRGYGSSLLLQGTFLLVFDLSMYFIQLNNADIQLYPIIDKVFSDYVGLGILMKI